MLHTRLKTPLKTLAVAIGFATLAACGGGGGDSSSVNSNQNSDSGTTDNKFTKQAKWQVTMPAIGTASSHCYDFDATTTVDCTSSTAWDIKLINSGRGVSLWTNSGTSGSGKGGALVSTWASLKTWQNATTEPNSQANMTSHYNADSTSSVFAENSWYAYNLQGAHKLAPNFRTYLITTDSSSADTASTTEKPVYALQVINYYSSIGTSGHITLRWINTATPTDVRTLTVDASSSDTWQYVNLASSGSLTTETGDWQVALQRYKVTLNGGDSKPSDGTGKVAGFLANTPDGFYDTDGKAITAKFTQDNTEATKANLTDVANYAKPSQASKWITDSNASSLNIAYTGSYPNPLDYGWYVFTPGTYVFSAKTENEATAALIRSNTGTSYARMRLSDISYVDASNYQSDTTWTFDLDIQPE